MEGLRNFCHILRMGDGEGMLETWTLELYMEDIVIYSQSLQQLVMNLTS